MSEISAKQVEQLLISSILRNNDMKNALSNGLSRGMFVHNSKEFNWIEDFWMKHGQEPKTNSFKVQFPAFRVLESDDTVHLVEKVREESIRRQVLALMIESSERMEESDSDASDVINFIHSGVININQNYGLIDDGDIFDEPKDVLADFELRRKRAAENGYSGVPTGFYTLDSRGGFDIGLTIVAARTGVGKSWFMQKAASEAAKKGYRVQFNALEQTRPQVSARIFSLMNDPSAEKKFSSRQLMQGKDYDPDDFREYLRDIKNRVNQSGALFIADTTKGDISIAQIASQIERNKPEIVYIDYLTLMKLESYDWMGLERAASDLTKLANRYQIPIVVAMQLNRNGTQSGAGVEALAGSDGPGRYASLIIFLRKPCEKVFEISVEKARDYAGGFSFFNKFNPERGEFFEIDYDVAMQLIEDAKDDEADLQ